MVTKIPFTKMHGLGNDFVLIENLNHHYSPQQFSIATLSDRHTGIGFDQCIFINKNAAGEFACQFFNADGSEAEQCGNGLRCVARFLKEKNLIAEKNLQLVTKAGDVEVIIHDFNRIEVNMGDPQQIMPDPAMTFVSMGNPHALLRVNDFDFSIVEKGQQVAGIFPESANVGFMKILSPHKIILRTYERGVGATFACGSNACAAVVAGIVNGWLSNKVTVELPLGELEILWEGIGHPVLMIGPATHIFDGFLNRTD